MPVIYNYFEIIVSPKPARMLAMPKSKPATLPEMDRFLVYLFTLFIVWPLWFVEQYSYSRSEILEELVKTGLVYWLVRSGGANGWRHVALIGIFFSLSETLFYLFVANTFLNLSPIYLRILATWPMHIVTVLVAWKLGTSKLKYGWILGFLAAVAVHAGFNWLVR